MINFEPISQLVSQGQRDGSTSKMTQTTNPDSKFKVGHLPPVQAFFEHFVITESRDTSWSIGMFSYSFHIESICLVAEPVSIKSPFVTERDKKENPNSKQDIGGV